MSTRDDGTGLQWAGALGLKGVFPPRRTSPTRATCGCSPRSRGSTAGRGGCWPRQLDQLDQRRPHAPRVPGAGPVHGVLPPPLHGAPRRRGLVVRPGGGARLPGALPVHVPGAPRDARRLRQSAVAHGDRRFAAVRRRGGRAGPAGPRRRQGHLGARDARRRRGHRRQRRGAAVRRGRHRDPSEPGADDARRADRCAAGRAQCDALLAEHRAPAHRHVGAAVLAARAGVVELPPPGGRAGTGHLRPDQAAAPRHRDPLPRHARGRDLVDPAQGDRPDGVRAPALQPRLGRRAGPAADGRHRTDQLRRRLPGLGVPRGRRALGPARRDPARAHLARGAASLAGRRRADRRLRDHDPAHPPYAVQALVHAPLAPVGRRSRRPARPRHAGAVRGPRPPRRPPGRSAPTSTPSSPATASTWPAAGW